MVTFIVLYHYTGERIAGVVEVATPIVQQVLASAKTSQLVGMFEPVEISVKNYRNYEQETFSFEDITFCTINGKNGAGKSSLFMDAILDCLYEEPREGDLTGWIRADEKARSGAISFTFKIGDTKYRVMRTRAKSGKATLNISEWVDSDWVNRSCEKIKDTQEAIQDIVGMDSLTFKSCALIMQDKYGLFLQADKESRVKILSNILGLGMYGEMQAAARSALGDVKREIALHEAEMVKLNAKIQDADDIELQACENQLNLKEATEHHKELSAEKEVQTEKVARIEIAYENAVQLRQGVNALKSKKLAVEAQRATQEDVLRGAEQMLCDEPQIVAGVEWHSKWVAAEKELAEQMRTYENVRVDCEKLETSVLSLVQKRAALHEDLARVMDDWHKAQRSLEHEAEWTLAHTQWLEKKEELAELEEVCTEFAKAQQEEVVAAQNANLANQKFNHQSELKSIELNQLAAKTKLLENAGCVDIANAKCRFLADAIEAQKKYDVLVIQNEEWCLAELVKLEKVEEILIAAKERVSALRFAPEKASNLRSEISGLEGKAMEYVSLGTVKERVANATDLSQRLDRDIKAVEQELATAREEKRAADDVLESLGNVAETYQSAKAKVLATAVWLKKEKQLPVARERQQTATLRLAEIAASIAELDVEINAKECEHQQAIATARGLDAEKECLLKINKSLHVAQLSRELFIEGLGALQNQLQQISADRDKMKELGKVVKEKAERADILDVLKVAFSPDGVPHNIIRATLPFITATANSILGQMTGGLMAMEFRTEKVLKSNNKKEVVTLDIFIEEAGRPALPYASKSGGEKVKSALSAILALAETKSTSAGIRLGMLFIDEPPFLDGDGMQAYCDALETICTRYSDIKIMAITHDPAMKARFPQNLDVVKTEQGSKVIFE